jgi:hypothetical protein
MATTVVPCGMSTCAGCAPAACAGPASGGAVRRRSSANEGPGSKPGPKRGSGGSFIGERAYSGEISANAAEQSPKPQLATQPAHCALVVDALEHVGRRQMPHSRADGNGRDRLSRPLPSALTSAEGLPRHAQSLRRTPPQRAGPLPGRSGEPADFCRTLLGVFDVERGAVKPMRIVSELAQSAIAVEAEDAPHATRHMIVVDVLRIGLGADRASATLATD